ncbi:helix-turn-helix domain-containing protein [Sandaracinobacter sp. RS1-74]|uniref:helix-turn-helix domain-containing protein n=1 Tax=Sandaracinobacteroides sayramensis TaxID=2913411 RepID=UPI001EDB2F6C|nr:helix-turn-helix domain-containing protein [Sandaracinobacteroides sayramensis]MCG2840643.1 helix-turn-helix domain-containing protein [Sandaracinobacteroides sayramensis]
MGQPSVKLDPVKLDEALRALRRRLGLTMAEVSQRTGVAVSTLSKVEAGKMSLTYDKLTQLCRGLGVDLAELLGNPVRPVDEGSATGRRSINRLGDGAIVRTEHYDHCYLSADVSGKAFVPLLVEPQARSFDAFPDFVRHAGEEFVYVLEGALEIHTEYYKPVVLQTGESMWLDSQMGHAYVAHGEGRCRVLAVCSGTETELIDALHAAGRKSP